MVSPKRSVELTRRAAKDLEKLEQNMPDLFGKVISKISSLENDPGAGKQLVGPFKGKRSVRVGAYRIIYQVTGSRCVVLTVNHRGDVYR